MYLRPWLDERGQAAFYRQIAQFDQRFTDEIEQRSHETGLSVAPETLETAWILMELSGLEPLTSWVRSRRSPN